MLHLRITWLAAVLALVGLALPVRAAVDKPPKKPSVEVVFCLDTTGSMGGLIEGAKQKIWSICNQIASGKPTPDLRVGLVAYRDRGDEYVTKTFDLSDDLDAIHGHLKSFQAKGGGDLPESVNQAMDDAVNKIKWSTDKDTLRIIFLVGDAPPHMDYADDVKYPTTCQKAARLGIIINTVQCGNNVECAMAWKDICSKAEGSYVKIAQDGGVAPVVATPFDKRLGEINTELARTTVVFGRRENRDRDLAKSEAAAKLLPEAAAARAGFQAKNAQSAAYDLIDNIKQNKVKLKDLKEDELPDELRKLKPEEREVYLKKLEEKREALRKEALELDKKRSDVIAAEQKKQAGKGQTGFDNQVLKILRKQAAKNKIAY